MAAKILVAVADGTEELEAVTIIDVLRRAGAEVTAASVGAQEITASRGVKLIADALIGDCAKGRYDAIVLPGGMPGAEHLRDCTTLIEMLLAQKKRGGWIAAICASPAVVLAHHGLLDGPATCYPSFTDRLPNKTKAAQRVVVDQKCITSQGPGTALDFALELVRQVISPKSAAQVADGMLAAMP